MIERPYILRLTNKSCGDGCGTPDSMWLIGPFADTAERANYISRLNPKCKPGWLPVNLDNNNGAPSGGLCTTYRGVLVIGLKDAAL